ncbi:hypothetical protein HOT57_gp12 [Pseudomonas phage phCDa]|uniref:Uncharacterized protein n=1 Tax=Pseudomonas phage phCDa TaxID=2268587 RepID=A0A2Z5H9U5_9CAUD|nr:hypothetical protein HOT57_gp12 [Pseudomonas phage phCDa]AXC36456.1 hypothetical protein phCDa_12 [Pseudomonas phage phCDa]
MTEQTEVQTPTELESLQKRAAQLNITIDGRWGVEKLREVVNAAVSGEKTDTVTAPAPTPAATPVVPETAAPAPTETVDTDEIKSPVAPTPSLMPSLASVASEAVAPENETEGQRKNRLRREAQALVRVNVSCMDPSKKNLKGDLLCVSNRNFGTIQRFVPFNRDWHIEKVLYDMLLEKEYLVFDSEKTGRAGIEVKVPRNVKAYNIRVLPPLTKGELKDLGQRQAMAAGTGE